MICAVLFAVGHAAADKVDELGHALLTDSSYKVKVQAALVLGKLGDRRAVPALLEALRDDNETVRGMAALSLGKIGDPRAQAPLRALENDASPFVRGNATKALASLSMAAPPPVVALDPGPSGARHFITVKITNIAGPETATRLLADATLAELAKLPRVTVSVAGATPSPAQLQQKRMAGWVLEGTLKLKVSGAGSASQLDCDVSANIATWPQRAIKATSSAGASIPGVRNASDASAQRQCFEAVAQGLADDMGKFLRTQP